MSPSLLARAELSPAEIIQADKSDRVIAWTCVAMLLIGFGYWTNEYTHRTVIKRGMEQCMADHGIPRAEWYSPMWKPLRGNCWAATRERIAESQ